MGNKFSELDAFWKDKSNVEEAKKVFAKYDVDNSGYLDRDEFSKFARDFWKYLEAKGMAKYILADKSMVESFLASRFDLLDVDKDGTISFEEFSSKIHLMATH
jgi:Ca2+-binding EF-hand superfamily protein